jgi:hypothetical protein
LVIEKVMQFIYQYIRKCFGIHILLTCIFLLSACASEDILTQEEIRTQDEADNAVSTLLFEREMTVTASYHVRKDGFVMIKFDKSVDSKTYTEVVQQLRASNHISGVRAEQMGKEVCPLK